MVPRLSALAAAGLSVLTVLAAGTQAFIADKPSMGIFPLVLAAMHRRAPVPSNRTLWQARSRSRQSTRTGFACRGSSRGRAPPGHARPWWRCQRAWSPSP
nr:hypothetical protein [Nocardia nova]